jgi:hypothetical protein
MSRGSPRFGLPLLCAALALAAACENNSSTRVTSPTAVTAESGSGSRITAEPVMLRPEILPGLSCVGSPPFGTRIIVVVSGAGVSLGGLRFRFTDRFGLTGLPFVRVIPGSSPMTTPVTMIPPLTGIPIPGLAPAPASTMSQLSNARFPFFLTFGCGFSTNGVLDVNADLIDGTGRSQTRALRVPLG